MIDLDAIKARLAEWQQADPTRQRALTPILMQDLEALIEEVETLRQAVEDAAWFAAKEED